MSSRRNVRIPVRLDPEEVADIRARAEALGVKVTPFIRDSALNAGIETSSERRRIVAGLFALQRELAGLVLLSREQWPEDEAAEMRDRARRISRRIGETIDDLAAQGVAS